MLYYELESCRLVQKASAQLSFALVRCHGPRMHLCNTIPKTLAKANTEADEIQFQEIPNHHCKGVPENIGIDFRICEFMDQKAFASFM